MGSGFNLFGAIGDAEPQHVLAGKRFSSEHGTDLVGTMVNRTGHVNAQSLNYTGQTLRFRPPQGYFEGGTNNSVQVSHTSINPANIKKGVNFANSGLVGTYKGISKEPNLNSTSYNAYDYLGAQGVTQIPNSSSQGNSAWWNDDGSFYVGKVTTTAKLELRDKNNNLVRTQNYSLTGEPAARGCVVFQGYMFFKATATEYRLYNWNGALIKTYSASTIDNVSGSICDIVEDEEGNFYILKAPYISSGRVNLMNITGTILASTDPSSMVLACRLLSEKFGIIQYMTSSGEWRYSNTRVLIRDGTSWSFITAGGGNPYESVWFSHIVNLLASYSRN